jgi:hypothetical protein
MSLSRVPAVICAASSWLSLRRSRAAAFSSDEARRARRLLFSL